MNNVLDAVMNESWAIMPNALESILKIVDRGIEASSIDPKVFHGSGQTEQEVLMAIQGEPLEGARRAVLRGSVGIIPVIGPIFPRANLFTEYSGATSVEMLANDLRVALDDPRVQSIILNIDSPGGAITRVSEFSDMVYNARREKPISAYVYGYAASAAYWIGSAADEVVTTDTGRIGSIGVVATWIDTRERDKMEGIEQIEIVSSQSPKKRLDPKTKTGKAQVQVLVDELADVFVAAVARNRDVSTDTVLSDFGEGDVFVAKRALEAGMADRIGSLEALIEEGNQSAAPNNPTRRFLMKDPQGTVPVTVESIRTSYPEVFKAIRTEGFEAGKTEGTEAGKAEGLKDGATAERDRIKAIMDVKAEGFENIIQEAAFDPEMTADKVATRILAAQNEERDNKSQAQKDDAGKVAAAAGKVVEKTDGPGGDDAAEAAALVEAGLKGSGHKTD